MKTEQKELTLCVPDQQGGSTFENFHVLRMMDDNGDEKTWEMHGFMEELYPPLHFKTEKEYMEYVKEWDWAFIFPKWEEISLPGIGAYLNMFIDDLAPNEIHQWLFDVLFEMRSHLDGFEVEEKVKVQMIEAGPNDPITFPKMTAGVLLSKPKQMLDVLFMPGLHEQVDPIDEIKGSMMAYMSLGHEQIPCEVTIPIVWNITQDKPNVFRRGDICKVRFVNCGSGNKMWEHPEWMTPEAVQSFSEIWNQWQ